MFNARSVDHVLLILWLCAGVLEGKSKVRCATILNVTRSKKNQNLKLRLYRYYMYSYVEYPDKEVEIGQNQGFLFF